MKILINLIRDSYNTFPKGVTLDVQASSSEGCVVLSLSDQDRAITVSRGQLLAALHALNNGT